MIPTCGERSPTPKRCAQPAHRHAPRRATTRSAPHRRRNARAPQTRRHRNESEPQTDTAGARNEKPPRRTGPPPCTAGAEKRKETPPPQARTDNAPNPERPEPTRRRASGGASSFTRFSGFRFPVRLAPDLRRWRAVPRRAGAVVVGGAPTDRVGGHAGDDGDLNETVSGSPWVTRARPDT